MSKFWDISSEGVAEIETLAANMEECMSRLDEAFRTLEGEVAEYGSDLGIYEEKLNTAVEVMGKLNEVNRESMERLVGRLEEFATKIEEELSKSEL